MHARFNGRPLLAAAALAAVLCAAVAINSTAGSATTARARPRDRASVSVRALALGWNVYAVGPHESSLELMVQHGVCGSVHAAVSESPRSLIIAPTETLGAGPCAGVSSAGPIVVRLAHPLAGRVISGPLRRSFATFFVRSRLDRVPRLVGFAPQDASTALGLVSLRARANIRSGPDGLRCVAEQDPAPGRPTPNSRVVQIEIARCV